MCIFVETEAQPEKISIFIRPKSGTIRPGYHGVKTKRGSRIFLDIPQPGAKYLIDDIHKCIIKQSHDLMPFTYSMEEY